MNALARAAERLGPETRGILGIVLAMLLFTCMDACAKYLMERLHPMMVTWARFAGQSVIVLLICLPALRDRFRTGHLGLQLARSTMHLMANLAFFIAISLMALAEAVAIFQVSPLLITLLAAIVLREQVGPRRWAGVVVGLIGTLIIIQPGLGVFQPVALLSFIAAACIAGFQIITRMIGTADSLWTTMLYSGLVGTVVMSAIVPFFWMTPSLEETALLIGFGWLGLLGHICLIYALGQAPASTLAPYNYAGFLWALVIGLIVFGEWPDYVTLLGASLILGAGIYVWHRERVRDASGASPSAEI